MPEIDIEHLRRALPLLADGLFDYLADTGHPDGTLAALDDAIRAGRLLVDAAGRGAGLWLVKDGSVTVLDPERVVAWHRTRLTVQDILDALTDGRPQ